MAAFWAFLSKEVLKEKLEIISFGFANVWSRLMFYQKGTKAKAFTLKVLLTTGLKQ